MIKLFTPPLHVVKPRKPVTTKMPIVVCDLNLDAHYERDNRMVAGWNFLELCHYLKNAWPRKPDSPKFTPIMLVCSSPHQVYLAAHDAFKGDPEWQARMTVVNDSVYKPEVKAGIQPAGRVVPIADLRIGFFGWRDKFRTTRYFHPISPHDFLENFSEYGETDAPEWLRLYEWGGRIRKWMVKNKMRFSASRGGLSAQLLRDARFYPAERRKVPKLTNENAREAMPGNFYAVTSVRNKIYPRVYVIDQQNAHHFAAKTVTLPNANQLYAKGRYRSLEDKPWVTPNSEHYDDVLKEHGLLRVRIWVPKGLLGSLPPWAQNPGLQDAWIYTNELPLLEELGVEIRHIAYTFTAPTTDRGLSKYAAWAEREAALLPKEKAWLKPTLLSAYGILGARPRVLESAYWRSVVGKPTKYFLGPHPITMRQIKGKRAVQTPIANTVHRGMIEAETRQLSIKLAREFEDAGNHVVSIHADAVIVHDEGQQIPLLTNPWRVKHELTRFRSIDSVSFESEAMTILPGRKRANRR